MIQPARQKKSRVRDHISNMESIERPGDLVYVLWCPIDKQIKYVGYTCSYPWDRLGAHMAEAKPNSKHPKSQWLMRLKAVGLLPTMRLMKCFDSKADAYRYEAYLIAAIGDRRTLTNRYPGFPNYKERPGWHFSTCKEPVFVEYPSPKRHKPCSFTLIPLYGSFTDSK